MVGARCSEVTEQPKALAGTAGTAVDSTAAARRGNHFCDQSICSGVAAASVMWNFSPHVRHVRHGVSVTRGQWTGLPVGPDRCVFSCRLNSCSSHVSRLKKSRGLFVFFNFKKSL